MVRETTHALVACVATFLLCAVAYPAVVWGLGNAAFPHQAQGSLVHDRDGTVIGSELIAQPFTSEKYFFPRPSAVGYKADATGGSNLGPKNPDLRKAVAERAEALKATDSNPAPVDLVTASGGGMDPHISQEAAYYQVPRVAAARKMSERELRALVDRHVEHSGAIIGAPARINVLRLNLDLDREKPASAVAAATEAASTSPETVPAPTATTTEAAASSAPVSRDAEAVKARLADIAGQVDDLGKLLAEIPKAQAAAEQKEKTGIAAIQERLDRLSENTRDIPRLLARVEGLDKRVKAADESMGALRAQLQEARNTLRSLPQPADAHAASRADLGPGLALFMKGDYSAAASSFLDLSHEHADDARVWYLAALSHGLATKKWDGKTEELVNKGLEREKEGTPSAAEIDAALVGLTTATGKDWLSFYRQRLSR